MDPVAAPAASQPYTLTRIRVQGFKSLGDVSVEICPLTVLAGANSSGKSSVMQPLLLIKQTLESAYNTGQNLLLDGPNVRLSDPAQVLPRGVEGDGRFVLEVESSERERTRLHYLLMDQMRIEGARGYVPGPATVEQAWKLDPSGRVDGSNTAGYTAPNGATYVVWMPIGVHLGDICRAMIHIPGLRGLPERRYPATASEAPYRGTFEPYTASVVARWQHDAPDKVDRLRRALVHLNLTGAVEARQTGATEVELFVGRLPVGADGPDDLVSIADVGFGVSQTLPVLVALIEARPGALVYIEQPELHLHPRAQRALAGLFADAARRGVRVIVETHSSLFLLGIQTLVAEGTLDPSLVALHWFSRDTKGFTKVTPATLDENGAFGPDWPEDFSDTELDAQSAFLDAAMARKLSSAK